MIDIPAIKARADKATAEPWSAYSAPLRKGLNIINEVQCVGDFPIVSWMGFDESRRSKAQHKRNAKFIAHARTDIPDLIAALEAAERERDACAGLASQAVSDMATAQNRVTALEAALSYYAKEHKNPSEGPWGLTSTDFGNVARRALDAKP